MMTRQSLLAKPGTTGPDSYVREGHVWYARFRLPGTTRDVIEEGYFCRDGIWYKRIGYRQEPQ